MSIATSLTPKALVADSFALICSFLVHSIVHYIMLELTNVTLNFVEAFTKVPFRLLQYIQFLAMAETANFTPLIPVSI